MLLPDRYHYPTTAVARFHWSQTTVIRMIPSNAHKRYRLKVLPISNHTVLTLTRIDLALQNDTSSVPLSNTSGLIIEDASGEKLSHATTTSIDGSGHCILKSPCGLVPWPMTGYHPSRCWRRRQQQQQHRPPITLHNVFPSIHPGQLHSSTFPDVSVTRRARVHNEHGCEPEIVSRHVKDQDTPSV